MTNISDEHAARIKLLAEGLKSHPPGHEIKLVLFLGAGAPRKAGLPLADELKALVLAKFGDASVLPDVMDETLEDLMQVLQSSLGNEGYELIAQHPSLSSWRRPKGVLGQPGPSDDSTRSGNRI